MAVSLTVGCRSLSAPAAFGHDANIVTEQMILSDPDAPVGGNPNGAVTSVAFVDYNCPFCKASAPDLDRVVRDDGHIRLVYKD